MDPLTISLILGGASFLGGLGGDKSRQTNRSTTRSTFDPVSTRMRGRLVDMMNRRLATGGAGAARNVTNTRLGGIADAGRAANTGLAARLSAMGIRGPAAGAATGALSQGIFGEHVGALNDEPLLARQFNAEDFDQAFSLMSAGRGSTTEGTGEATAGGGPFGGFADMGQMLGWLAGQGLLTGGGKTPATGPRR